MESHSSCEKLVTAEAGLIAPNFANNVPFGKIPRPNGSSNKLTNCLLISVMTVLLFIVSYEIWQVVRAEQLIKDFETENLPPPVEQLPLLPEDTRIQDMVKELKRVQDKLKELQEKIHHQDLNSATTELPITTSSELTADEIMQNFERDLLKGILEASMKDYEKSSISEEMIPVTLDSSNYTVIENDIIQDIEKSDKSESITLTDSIDELGLLWFFSFHFGEKSENHDSSEELNVTERDETEVTNSEDGWYISVPEVVPNPSKETYTWIWDFGSTDKEDSKSSESGESVEEKIDSVEIQKVKPQEETTVQPSSEVYGDYYYDSDDLGDNSYEYTSWLRGNLFTESEDISSTDDHLENSSTESSSSSTETQDEVKPQESTTTEATVSFTSASHTSESFSEGVSEDPENSYDLSSKFWELLGIGATLNGEDIEHTSSSSGEDSEDSPKQNATVILVPKKSMSESYASGDEYLKELSRKRLAEVEYLEQQYAKIFADTEFSDQYVAEYYDDDLESPATTSLSSTPNQWSYISKRSVDTPSELDTSVTYLTAKELDHKMGLVLQAINDDNHLLQNEVSLAAEPLRDVLQSKLNNFYAKMDAVSAHIDRLHERYIRLNELNDDYVSKEFSPEEFDTTSDSDY